MEKMPTLKKIDGTKPKDGWCGSVFLIDPPIRLDDGRQTHYVTTSTGSETVMGEGRAFNVFPSDEFGRFLDWGGLMDDDGCGPEWCIDLIGKD